MSMQLYLTGYKGRSPVGLVELADQLNATVVDIRFQTFSRSEWAGFRLRKVLPRYQWVKAFGNELYKTDGYQIHDFPVGLAALQAIQTPVILLCVCTDAALCHRTLVARMIYDATGLQASEVTIPNPGTTNNKEAQS